MPTVKQIVQNGCLQFIGFVGHYFTPVCLNTDVSTFSYTVSNSDLNFRLGCRHIVSPGDLSDVERADQPEDFF